MGAKQRLEAWIKIDNLARANPDIHKLTSLMKECTFMEIEIVDNVNAVSNETTDNDKIIMNNINNLMAVDDNDDSKIITNLDNGDNNEDISGLEQSNSDINITRKFQEEVLASAKSNIASNQKGYCPANVNLNIAEPKPLPNADKPLLRRKSELPTDQYTQSALES